MATPLRGAGRQARRANQTRRSTRAAFFVWPSHWSFRRLSHAQTFNEQQIMLIVLALIDVVMISNLLVMVIVGGYETFVSRLHLDGHPDQPEWLSHVNASVLKIKLAMAGGLTAAGLPELTHKSTKARVASRAFAFQMPDRHQISILDMRFRGRISQGRIRFGPFSRKDASWPTGQTSHSRRHGVGSLRHASSPPRIRNGLRATHSTIIRRG